MIDIEVNGIKYKSNLKLNAVEQFFLSKRLVPILDVFVKIKGMRAPDPADFMVTLADGISKLKDEDCLYIFDLCLNGMQCHRDGAWGLVWNRSARTPQYQDLDLSTMIQLTYHVVLDNLGSFMSAPSVPFAVATTPANG
jgi:hypothetical protein